jgi:predicted nucleic acid-binding protein
MIAVSNTSPLANLAAIGEFELLGQMFGRLHIAQGVWEELNAKEQHWPGRAEVAKADWIERHVVQNEALVVALRRDLGKGEAETIALALELNANLIVLDEWEGRHAA